MHQGQLFGEPERPAHTRHRDRPPIAANADPETNRLSAVELTDSGERDRQCRMVAGLVRRWPGLTSKELSEASGVDRHLLAKRLPDAEARDRTIRRGEARPCRVTWRSAITWFPVPEGER